MSNIITLGFGENEYKSIKRLFFIKVYKLNFYPETIKINFTTTPIKLKFKIKVKND